LCGDLLTEKALSDRYWGTDTSIPDGVRIIRVGGEAAERMISILGLSDTRERKIGDIIVHPEIRSVDRTRAPAIYFGFLDNGSLAPLRVDFPERFQEFSRHPGDVEMGLVRVQKEMGYSLGQGSDHLKLEFDTTVINDGVNEKQTISLMLYKSGTLRAFR
jgi:hypothetical protein